MDWAATQVICKSFVHRGDINWATLQPLALDDIDGVLSVQENEGAASLTLATSALSGAFSATLPVGYVRSRAVFDSGGVEMTLTDINGLVSRPGSQRFCAISGGSLYAYIGAASIVYSKKTPVLVADSDHNYLTDRYSGVLVYGLLKHAAHQVQDFDARDQHQQTFDYLAGVANANYAMATLGANNEARSPYLAISN